MIADVTQPDRDETEDEHGKEEHERERADEAEQRRCRSPPRDATTLHGSPLPRQQASKRPPILRSTMPLHGVYPVCECELR
jgi:hypothetical protein